MQLIIPPSFSIWNNHKSLFAVSLFFFLEVLMMSEEEHSLPFVCSKMWQFTEWTGAETNFLLRWQIGLGYTRAAASYFLFFSLTSLSSLAVKWMSGCGFVPCRRADLGGQGWCRLIICKSAYQWFNSSSRNQVSAKQEEAMMKCSVYWPNARLLQNHE